MCDKPIYCELCGECINCYGEDPCYFSTDGKHMPPEKQLEEERGERECIKIDHKAKE